MRLQLVADRDKLTRSAALSMLATAYTMEGAPLWRVRAAVPVALRNGSLRFTCVLARASICCPTVLPNQKMMHLPLNQPTS